MSAQSRVSATAAARSAIERLRADRGPVMFVQSGGCCAGSAPMCYPDGEFLVGPGDVLLGEVAGCPVYIDARLDRAWGQAPLVLDVAPGDPEGFSLPAGEPHRHFVSRTPSCPVGDTGG